MLLLRLLLPIHFRRPRSSPGPPKGDKNLLPLPGCSLYHSSNRGAVLSQRHPIFHRILFVAPMPRQFWRRVLISFSFRQFDCVGPSAIYRMSLSILCLFGLMMIFMLCRNRIAMVVNEGLFCVKYIFVTALFIGFLWVDNNVF
jgi:hypothetical protein